MDRQPALGTGAASGALTGSVAGGNADALHAVLVKAMDADPGRRYPTALAFAAALEAATRGEHPRSLAPSPVVPLAVALPGATDAVLVKDDNDDDDDDISAERTETGWASSVTR